MRRISGKVTIIRWYTPICYLCFAIMVVSVAISIEGCTKIKNNENLGYLNFSPDGKKLLFFSQNSNKGASINMYNMETGVLSAYQPPWGETWSDAKYSFDGQKIVFITMPFVDGKYDMIKTQITIMDVDGKNYRRLTNGDSFKIYPSFSHDGKKIIYCKAGAIRTSGRTRAADYDIYEIDIDTGNEMRLTDLKLFSMSTPYLFPDDETIIFSAYGYERKTTGICRDEIYTVKKGAKKPEHLFYSKNDVYSASITPSGTIYFQTQANNPDGSGNGYQIFQYSADGQHRRISNIPWSTTWRATVSPDGQFIAVVFGDNSRRIVVYNINDSTSKEIKLPDNPSIIINIEELKGRLGPII